MIVASSAASTQADAGTARRLAELAERVGVAVQVDVATRVEAAPADSRGGSIVPAKAADELVARHGLASRQELALLALPVAVALARPPISGYRVGAIGIEAGSGDLVLGANLEFRGSDLGSTIHAEGFVALRARRRGEALAILAVRAAHPCAHCRQTLAELATADDLRIVDLLGHDLRLEELYPSSFRPAALGKPGDGPGKVPWPTLAFTDQAEVAGADAAVGVALLFAGARAHAPYSRAPSAVVVRLRDGRLLSAGCVESVAFNPTITALQATLVEVLAARSEPGAVVEAWLGRTSGGPVDPEPGFRALLQAVAPGARASVFDWNTGS